MKRIIILLGVTFTFMINLLGCSAAKENMDYREERNVNQNAAVYEKIKETAKKLNENSNLYIELLTPVNETEYALHFDVKEIRRGFYDPPMPNEFDIKGEGGGIQGIGGVRPFPWASEELRIIHISWSERGTYHVFGIDVGDCLEVAKEILHEQGYVIDDTNPQSDWNRERFGYRTTYIKDYVVISLFVSEDGEGIIRISTSIRDPFMQRSEPGVEGVDWVS